MLLFVDLLAQCWSQQHDLDEATSAADGWLELDSDVGELFRKKSPRRANAVGIYVATRFTARLHGQCTSPKRGIASKRRDRIGFIVLDVEKFVELGDCKHFVDFRANVAQLQSPAIRFYLLIERD